MLKKLLVGVVVLAVLLVAGDAIGRTYAQDRAATKLRDGLGLSSTPDVSIEGWPFVVHLIAQSFPTVTVSGKDVHVEGLAVTRFELTLHDVAFSIQKLASGKHAAVRIQSGDGSVALSSRAIDDRLAAAGSPFELSIDGDRATLSSSTLGTSVSADVTIEDHSLTLHPPGVAPISVELPQISELVEYRSVDVTGGLIRAVFHLRAGSIPLGR